MTKLADLKQRLLENPEVREEYARADAEFSVIQAMSEALAHAKGEDLAAGDRKEPGTIQRALAG